MTLTRAVAILMVLKPCIERCPGQRGNPQGLSRFLHGRLLSGLAAESAPWFLPAVFVGSWKAQHVADHPDLGRSECRECLAQAADQPVHLLWRVRVDDQFALRSFSSSLKRLSFFKAQVQRRNEPLDELLSRWPLEARFERGDVALLVSDALRKVHLADAMTHAEVMQKVRKGAHDQGQF